MEQPEQSNSQRQNPPQKPKKRVVNFRSFLFIAANLIAAILFLRLILVIPPLGLILFIAQLLTTLGLFFVYAYKKAPKFKLVTFLAAFFLCIVAGLNMYVGYVSQPHADEHRDYIISGKTDEIDYTHQRLVIKNLRLNGKYTDGKMMLYADFDEYPDFYDLRIGDNLTFEGKIRNSPVFGVDGSVNAFNYRTRILFRCYEFSETVYLDKAQPDFFQSLSVKMQHNLTLAMGADLGGVAYGFITGDKSGIRDEVRDAYSVSGLAHILAVSGLHVGFLSAMLLGLFRLMRLKKLPANLITMAVLWFYAFFTGLSPSVLRAVTMASVMMLGMIFSKRYDSLNSLASAVAVILVVYPLYLFEVGFILSASAVFGIILFAKPLSIALQKIKLPKYLSRLTATSVAVQIGIVPAMIIYFKSVQVYAIFLNILIMPVINLAFVLIFVTLLLSLIWQPLYLLLGLAGIPMALIDSVAASASFLPYARIFVTAGAATALLYLCYPLHFCASRFMLRPKGRRSRITRNAACFALSISLCLAAVFSTRYYGLDGYIAPLGEYRDVTAVVRDGGKTYIVGDFRDFYSVDNTLKKLGVRCVDGIFLTELSSVAANAIERFSNRYRAGEIWTYAGADLSGAEILDARGIKNHHVFGGDTTVAGGIAPVVANGRLMAYELLTDGGSLLLCGYGTAYTRLPADVISRAYAIRCFMYLDEHPEKIFITNMESGFRGASQPAYQYSPAESGDFLFDYRVGKVFGLR
ncbi:MAG: ComEC/Rec2 family competence protein [Firmicutes bacterium]|nr:ComEC/Rec2 family competence protein [Bacillota bacterium]